MTTQIKMPDKNPETSQMTWTAKSDDSTRRHPDENAS
jgi:hypothetical protein